MKFLESFFSPKFYAHNKLTPSGGIKRVFLVYLCIGLFSMFTFYIHFGKSIPFQLQGFSDQVISGYPDDLIIQMASGTLISSSKETLHLYPITLSKEQLINEQLKGIDPSQKTKFAVVIQGSEAADLGREELENAFVVLSKHEMFAQQNAGDIRLVPYNEAVSFTINKQSVINIRDKVVEYIPLVVPVISLFIFISVFIFSSLGFFLWACIMSLIIMALSKVVIKRKVSYGDAYLLTLYVGVIPEIVKTILSSIPHGSSFIFPFFGTLLTLLLIRYFYVEGNKDIQRNI